MKPEHLNSNVEFNKGRVSISGAYKADSTHKSLFLAKKIEDGMKGKGLTRQSFSQLMNVQPSIITRWLSGKHNFTVETLFDIEDKLNIKLIAIAESIHSTTNYHMVVNSARSLFSNTKDVQDLLITFPVARLSNDSSEDLFSLWKSSDL
jgi:transcriptional regulator with XRE-family HTH domain